MIFLEIVKKNYTRKTIGLDERLKITHDPTGLIQLKILFRKGVYLLGKKIGTNSSLHS